MWKTISLSPAAMIRFSCSRLELSASVLVSIFPLIEHSTTSKRTFAAFGWPKGRGKLVPINEFVSEMKNRLRKTYMIAKNRLRLASDCTKAQKFLLEIIFGCTTQIARKDDVQSCMII